MRLRGVYLLAVAASAAVALTFAGSAGAATTPDPACGKTLTTSFTLTADINCTGSGGSALVIGQAGITVNLNGHTITGDTGHDVIDNTSAYDGLTVENGTLNVVGNGLPPNDVGIDNGNGGDGLVVSNVTIAGTGSGTEGVLADGVSATVTDSTIGGVTYAVDFEYTAGALVKGNTITVKDGEYGVLDEDSTGDMISGNTITSDDPQNGYGIELYTTAGTEISGNTVTLLQYGLYDGGDSAGLMITGNVFGGNTGSRAASGNFYGIYLDPPSSGDSGDVISGNYIRNSLIAGVWDFGSFNNAYTGNVVTNSGGFGFYVDPNENGPVTMVNNYSRLSGGIGFSIGFAFSGTVPGGPYSLFSGNTATYNGGDGFDDSESVGATWTKNTAYGNRFHGFSFATPERETISNNSATLNGSDGFFFTSNSAPYAPLAVTDNTATYNNGYGFNAQYPTAGAGNTGSDNADGPCHLVAGCSGS